MRPMTNDELKSVAGGFSYTDSQLITSFSDLSDQLTASGWLDGADLSPSTWGSLGLSSLNSWYSDFDFSSLHHTNSACRGLEAIMARADGIMEAAEAVGAGAAAVGGAAIAVTAGTGGLAAPAAAAAGAGAGITAGTAGAVWVAAWVQKKAVSRRHQNMGCL